MSQGNRLARLAPRRYSGYGLFLALRDVTTGPLSAWAGAPPRAPSLSFTHIEATLSPLAPRAYGAVSKRLLIGYTSECGGPLRRDPPLSFTLLQGMVWGLAPLPVLAFRHRSESAHLEGVRWGEWSPSTLPISL